MTKASQKCRHHCHPLIVQSLQSAEAAFITRSTLHTPCHMLSVLERYFRQQLSLHHNHSLVISLSPFSKKDHRECATHFNLFSNLNQPDPLY